MSDKTLIPHLDGANPALTLVVMAKPAVPGRVKTRLIGPLTPQQAAEVHEAMLACVLERVAMYLPGRRVLAMADEDGPPLRQPGASPPGSRSAPGLEGVPGAWEMIDQGTGDLGQRLAHVWRAIGGGAAAFFGVDSPDVPAGALRRIRPALAAVDAAVGPVSDGGYWTLAARRLAAPLLRDIDWGTATVYDQTCAAARGAGLSLSTLPGWHDVDDPTDLDALRQRLRAATEPALVRLRERLRTICEDSHEPSHLQ